MVAVAKQVAVVLEVLAVQVSLLLDMQYNANHFNIK
jgi:hypothetical protein